jgi:predicted ABC-type ATPase
MSADEAVVRVANRVRQGGHHIPEDTIRRRFDASLRSFHDIYRHRVDYWQLFDTSCDRPLLLAEGAHAWSVAIKDKMRSIDMRIRLAEPIEISKPLICMVLSKGQVWILSFRNLGCVQ